MRVPLLRHGDGAGEGGVGAVVRGVEGFYFADGRGEDSGLRDVELVLYGRVLLGIDVEPVVDGRLEDLAVALRGYPPGAGSAWRGIYSPVAEGVAVVSGELTHRAEAGVVRRADVYEAAVLVAADAVADNHLLTDRESFACAEFAERRDLDAFLPLGCALNKFFH